jgi:hypothetical protein
MLSGAQTAKRRKAGSRVTTPGTFAGGGQALNADEEEKGTGIGFRRKAGRCVDLFFFGRSAPNRLMSHDLASEPARNGLWLRKDACLLHEVKVNGILYVA